MPVLDVEFPRIVISISEDYIGIRKEDKIPVGLTRVNEFMVNTTFVYILHDFGNASST